MSEPVSIGTPPATEQAERSGSLVLRELPYLVVLAMTMIGVAYTSAARQPLVLYWEVLALTVFALCIFAGWKRTEGRDARVRMLWTQTSRHARNTA